MSSPRRLLVGSTSEDPYDSEQEPPAEEISDSESDPEHGPEPGAKNFLVKMGNVLELEVDAFRQEKAQFLDKMDLVLDKFDSIDRKLDDIATGNGTIVDAPQNNKRTSSSRNRIQMCTKRAISKLQRFGNAKSQLNLCESDIASLIEDALLDFSNEVFSSINSQQDIACLKKTVLATRNKALDKLDVLEEQQLIILRLLGSSTNGPILKTKKSNTRQNNCKPANENSSYADTTLVDTECSSQFNKDSILEFLS